MRLREKVKIYQKKEKTQNYSKKNEKYPARNKWFSVLIQERTRDDSRLIGRNGVIYRLNWR